jgi:hypothetical protein
MRTSSGMTGRPEHEGGRERRTDDRRWMAEFEEELRRLHEERLQPPRLRSVLVAKLREWWHRAR